MKRYLLMVGLAALAACRPAPTTSASGTVEFTQTDVAAMVPARVLRVPVDEGAMVRLGDTVAILTQTGLPQDIDQRRARLAVAEAELRDLQRGARPEEIERAEAEVRSAEVEAGRTATDSARLSGLLRTGGVSQAAVDAAVGAARVAGARRDAARESLRLLVAGARPQRIEAARAAAAVARAQLRMGEAAAGDLVLTAPSDGQVLARHAEPGEVLAAGVPVISLGDPRRAWVRVFVPAPVFASIRPGDLVPLTIDGLPGRAFTGRVTALATTAEFTPRVALTEKERADLLFGVRMDISDTTGTLKAGLPATARFARPGGTAGPAAPRDTSGAGHGTAP